MPPQCVESLLADAHAGAPWRAALSIAEPSAPLSEAVRLLERAVRTVTPPGGEPTLDELFTLTGGKND